MSNLTEAIERAAAQAGLEPRAAAALGDSVEWVWGAAAEAPWIREVAISAFPGAETTEVRVSSMSWRPGDREGASRRVYFGRSYDLTCIEPAALAGDLEEPLRSAWRDVQAG
ncbi:MAG: hypothetical protein GC160_13225 [Acidobacteria bacterium]|nr:hypothetical protein [Acidobacteriota bacterium]